MGSEPDKQAVLVIHGIGEQRPMATLRGLVDAVWTSDTALHHPFGVPTLWSKPDTISGSFELRRLTTGQNRSEVRTDFYELYWAHLMFGTSVSHVAAWAKLLLLRPPWKVPVALRGAWLLLVAVAVVVLGLLGFAALGPAGLELPRWLSTLGGVVLAVVAGPLVRGVIGDAARYLDPAPGNVERRQEIRAKGVEILQKLHDSGEYRRIVVVGHSLGSVIGYDVLTHAWALFHREPRGGFKSSTLDQLEAMAAADEDLDVDTWQHTQRRLLSELASAGNRWRVSDFVTLGSPLAHAALLLASDHDDLARKQLERELPTSPPVLEDGRCSYPPKAKRRTLHHAFGAGIRDLAVSTRARFGLFSHTRYWSPAGQREAGTHLGALRDALDLADRNAPASESPGIAGEVPPPATGPAKPKPPRRRTPRVPQEPAP